MLFFSYFRSMSRNDDALKYLVAMQRLNLGGIMTMILGTHHHQEQDWGDQGQCSKQLMTKAVSVILFMNKNRRNKVDILNKISNTSPNHLSRDGRISSIMHSDDSDGIFLQDFCNISIIMLPLNIDLKKIYFLLIPSLKILILSFFFFIRIDLIIGLGIFMLNYYHISSIKCNYGMKVIWRQL